VRHFVLVLVSMGIIYVLSQTILLVRCRISLRFSRGESCVDAVAVVSSSPDLTDHVSLNPLDISYASSCSLPSPSPQYCDLSPIDSLAVLKGNVVDCSESLDTFRGHEPFLDPYRLYLEGMPGEITLIIAFDYSADFS